jgi:hypothetical protein
MQILSQATIQHAPNVAPIVIAGPNRIALAIANPGRDDPWIRVWASRIGYVHPYVHPWVRPGAACGGSLLAQVIC